jgi:hypothetical protein
MGKNQWYLLPCERIILMPKTKRKLDSSELIREVTDTLSLWEGKDIAEKAEEILGHSVTYLGDDLYEIKE